MHPRPSPCPDYERLEDIMADALALGRIAARHIKEVSLRGERLPDGGWLARQLTGPGLLEPTVHDALDDVMRALREREDAGWTLMPVEGDPARRDLGLTPEAQTAAHARGAIEETLRHARRVVDLLAAEVLVATQREELLRAKQRREGTRRP